MDRQQKRAGSLAESPVLVKVNGFASELSG